MGRNLNKISNEKNLAVGKMFAAKRSSLGLTAKQVAKEIGCSEGTIYCIEKGVSLKGKYTYDLAVFYNFDESFLSFNSVDKVKGCKLNLSEAKKEGLDLIYMKVSDERFELPVACASSSHELAKLLGIKECCVSNGVAKHLEGKRSLYRVTISPICDNDEIEQNRLEHFFKGEFNKCPNIKEHQH